MRCGGRCFIRAAHPAAVRLSAVVELWLRALGAFIPRSREEPGLSLGNKHPLRAPSQEAGPHSSFAVRGARR